MRVGTKSILFGAHQFILHPLLVGLAWWKLYGLPLDPRLWLAFIVHDLGYWGKPNMDGPEGERHVEWGARLMGTLFGREWHDLCLYHSRFYAKKDGAKVSRLCVADKLSLVITPPWLYLLATTATGEIEEYIRLSEARTAAGEPKYAAMKVHSESKRQWLANVQEYLKRWVEEFKDGKEDTWTPSQG